VAAGLLDYVLKAQASAHFAGGESLLRFFGLFYTGISILTFLVQSTLSRRVLENAGLARAVASLPGTVVVGSIAGLFAPGLASAGLARGGEAVVHNSVYRSGYELLFNPISPDRKRSTKIIVDVGFDRLGDAAGGGLVKAVLIVAPQLTQNLLLGVAALISVVSLFVASRLHRGYVKTLERNLQSRAIDAKDIAVGDRITRDTILQTMGSLGLSALRRQAEGAEIGGSSSGPARPKRVYAAPSPTGARGAGASPRAEPAGRSAAPTENTDPLIRQIAELRSGDSQRIIPLLGSEESLSTAIVPHLISLLAWDEVAQRAVDSLRKIAPRATGQLCDALLDTDSDFAIRRRIPRVLAVCDSERAVQGLLAAAEREVTVDRRVWESRRLLDSMPDSATSPFEDEYLQKRATRSLEHVFTMMSLVLPREPLMIAYRGLHTDDRFLRGTALEYLENVLPSDLREKLWPFLEQESPGEERVKRTREEVLEALMKSNQSIEINLRELRGRDETEEPEGS
jgi:hypothetical protein